MPRHGCGSPRRRWSGWRRSGATSRSTSSGGCATGTAHGSSGSISGSRATRTTDGRTDVAVAGRLMAEMIDAERDVLKEMRRERAFPVEVLREIERELDLDESRLRARIRL